MLNEVFDLWISVFSKIISWLFTLELNSNPSITLGEFILACAFIGVVLYFILGTDFIPGMSYIVNNNSSSNGSDYNPKHIYQPKHSRNSYAARGKHIGNSVGVNNTYQPSHAAPGPRESRH